MFYAGEGFFVFFAYCVFEHYESFFGSGYTALDEYVGVVYFAVLGYPSFGVDFFGFVAYSEDFFVDVRAALVSCLTCHGYCS